MGGIKKGMVVTDAMASNIDHQVRTQCKIAYARLRDKYPDLEYCKKLPKGMIPGGIGSCAPDGGIWKYRGKLIAAFEAKKQNNKGNAIERWFKNQDLCRTISSDVSYVTFCVGEGAKNKGVMQYTLHYKHLHGYNKYRPGECSTWMSELGFSNEDILDTVLNVLEERCMSINNEH